MGRERLWTKAVNLDPVHFKNIVTIKRNNEQMKIICEAASTEVEGGRCLCRREYVALAS